MMADELPAIELANVEAEAAILGALMIENSLVDQVADRLMPQDFYEPVHARIFETIVQEVSRGRSATAITLKPYLEQDEGLKALGGIVYLARLTADGQGLLAMHDLTEQILDLSARRKMKAGLQSAVDACRDMDATLNEIVAHADSALELRMDDNINQVSGADAIADLLKSYEQPISGVKCRDIPEVDRILGPMRPKQLVICAARPGMGKTAFALSYALGAARNGHGVLFVSLEMSSRELAARMAAEMCFTHGENSVPFSAINEGRLEDWQMRRVVEAESRLRAMPFHMIDTGSLTTGRLNILVKRYARRYAARGQKLELVVVDYLQLMRTGHRDQSRYEAISEVSQSLKAIAKDHGVAVMALAQLSREVEKRPDKRPSLGDLRDSGQIEQDADVVMFLLREEYYLEQTKPPELSPKYHEWLANMEAVKGRIEFILAKRRNGRPGIAIGDFHGAFQAVR